MPHFSKQIETKGLLVNVWFTVSDARAKVLASEGMEIPKPVEVQGLIDTGASNTCVTPDVIEALDLTASDTEHAFTPSGSMSVNVYDVGLSIYSRYEEAPVRIPNLRVSETEALLKQDLRCLLGMDVLSRCLLVVNGQARFYTLAFRKPNPEISARSRSIFHQAS